MVGVTELLQKRILSLNRCGAAPTHAHAREIAHVLLAKRDFTHIHTLGERWGYTFTHRHPEPKYRFSR
jgi:hypothetical protein